MNKKWLLYLGIGSLIIGIVVRAKLFSPFVYLPFIATGVSLKLYYIFGLIRNQIYKPGYEMAILAAGLALYFGASFLKKHETEFNYYFLMIPGIALKILFVVLFIVKVRKVKVFRNG